MNRPLRLNELADPLVIPEDRGRWPAEGSMCALKIEDRRHYGTKRERPAAIILSSDGFEATFFASHADLVAIRDWTSKAIAALEATRPELTDAGV